MVFIKWAFAGLFVSISIYYLQWYKSVQNELYVSGFVHPQFNRVMDVFKTNLDSGKEKGAAFSVFYKGEALVDIWGGYADVESGVPWSQFTTTQVFSATKGVAALLLAIFVDKGLLQYDQPVSKYWPEFGQNDKENITVAMLLSHTAGLAVLDEPVSLLDLANHPDDVEKLLARQATVWPAGTHKGYHSITYGLYVEQLLKKIDPKHRPVNTIFKEDIAEPFNIDFSINVENDQYYRTARIHLYPYIKVILQLMVSPEYRAMYFDIITGAPTLCGLSVSAVKELGKPFTIFNNPYIRNISLLSVSGTGTARSLAKLYSVLASGGHYRGRQLLSKKQIQKLSEAESGYRDIVLYADSPPFAMGTMVLENPDGKLTFGHTGVGGQVAMADPSYGIGISYVTNHLTIYAKGDDPRFKDLEAITYECLKKFKNTKYIADEC